MDRDDDADRASIATWGFSRPQSLAVAPGLTPQPQPPPRLSSLGNKSCRTPVTPGPDGLKPLLLVQKAKAMAALGPVTQDIEQSVPVDAIYRPDKMRRIPPPPAPVAWPEMGSVLSFDEQTGQMTASEAEDAIPMQPVRHSVHYDINARTRDIPRKPIDYSVLLDDSGPSTQVPPAARTQEPSNAEQTDMALDALRAQGSWLPDLLNQARKGRPLVVPSKKPAGPSRRI